MDIPLSKHQYIIPQSHFIKILAFVGLFWHHVFTIFFASRTFNVELTYDLKNIFVLGGHFQTAQRLSFQDVIKVLP